MITAIAFLCAVAATVGFYRGSGTPAAVGVAVVTTVIWFYSGDLALVVPFAVVGVALAVRRPWHAASSYRSARDLIYGGGAVLAGYVLYELGRVFARGHYEDAHRHALSVIDLERRLHVFQEPRIQSDIMSSAAGEATMLWLYAHLFLGVVLASLLWLFFTDTPRFRQLGFALAVAAFLGIITVRLFPVAPPRLVPEAGIIDSFAARGREQIFVNQYAAIPSLHVGWLAACGVLVALSVGRWWGWFATAPAVLMAVAVVATGNHLVADIVVGVIYSLVPLAVWGAARAWRFSGASPTPDARTPVPALQHEGRD